MKARVYVTLKKSVFDPQGQAIHDALHTMGYAVVSDVRQGKFFELELGQAVSVEAAQKTVEEIAHRILANPVIESYRVELEP